MKKFKSNLAEILSYAMLGEFIFIAGIVVYGAVQAIAM